MHYRVIFTSLKSLVAWLPLLLILSCSSHSDIDDSSVLGSWRATKIGELPIQYPRFGRSLTLIRDHTFYFYEIRDGREFGRQSGTWELSEDNERTKLVLTDKQLKQLKYSYFLRMSGDTLAIVEPSTLPGVEGAVWTYVRSGIKPPTSDSPPSQGFFAMSPPPNGSAGFLSFGIIIGLLFLVLLLRWLFIRDKNLTILSRWHHLFENLSESSQEFYKSLEEAVKTRTLPGVHLSRVDHHEGGMFSAKREYLRVKRKEHIFDVCAAPFGNGFFFSWWLGEKPSAFWTLVILVPLLGPWLFNRIRPYTYYRLDTATMFQDSVHSAVLEVLDGITKTKGLRALSELERKPIMTELFKR